MASRENAVSRLLALLKKATKTDGPNQAQAWATIFSIDAKDTSKLLYLLAELLHQIHEARKAAMVAAKRQPGYTLRLAEQPFDQLDQLFRQHLNLRAKWLPLKQAITSELLTGLSYVAELVATTLPAEEVDASTLKTLRKHVVDLLAFLEGEDDVDTELAIILRRHLNNLLDAIDYYEIRGLSGLRDALEMSAGAMHRNATRHPNPPDKVAQATTRFVGLLIAIDRVLTIAEKHTPMLATAARALLPEGVVPEIPDMPDTPDLPDMPHDIPESPEGES